MNIEDYDNLPDQMINAKRWLVWKSIPNQDTAKKPRKVPYYVNGTPRTGALDSVDDLNNLATFQTAFRALATNKYTGLGFALGEDKETGSYFQGVDIDKISQHPELMPIVEDLPGYVEKSPSGDGYHAIGYGKKFDPIGSNSSGIEAYSFGRYFAVTGHSVSGFTLSDLSDIVVKRLKPIHTLPLSHSSIDYEKVSIEDVRLLRSALNCFQSDDRDRWIRYGQALCKLGAVGRSLWMDWSQQSDKHDPIGDAKTWDSFRGDNTGFPAIFKDAYAIGWDGNKKSDETPKDSDNTVWLNADEMADNATAPIYLINNILESKTHGLIAGSSQSFKSFCVIKMAHSICTGKDFFGHEVFDTGKVLYICGEGHGALQRRVRAIKIVEGGFNNNFFVLSRPLFIDNIAEIDWLTKQVVMIRPVLVIYDTFSSLATSTKENANEEVARCLRMVSSACLDAGSSSIVVHHYGKDQDKGTRGASAFGANVDFEFMMKRGEGLNAVMSCKKSKDGDFFEDIEILAHIVDIGLSRQDGMDSSSLILKRSDVGGALTNRQSKAIDVIRETIISAGQFVNGKNGLTERQIKEAFFVAFEDEGKHKYQIFRQVIPNLLNKKILFNSDGVYHF